MSLKLMIENFLQALKQKAKMQNEAIRQLTVKIN